MSKKSSALQAALSQNGGGRRSAAPEPAEAQPGAVDQAPASTPQRSASREGKVNVSAWLSPDFKRSLRMVQAVTDKKLEPLMAEALNDLFAKYNVPQIRE